MTERSNLMPIGRFAAAVRLSIKALRHYDEQNLLTPAWVDPDSGYRYYARDQARRAVLIGMLRELQMPIARIQSLLAANPGERKLLLAGQRAQVDAELRRNQRRLASIDRLLREDEWMPYPVTVREEPELFVAQTSMTTTPESIISDSTALIEDLFQELQDAGREVLAPVLCINEDPVESDGEETIVVHACVRLEPPAPALPTARAVEVRGGPMAVLLHRGSYEELGIAYHALNAWVQERGHRQRGPLREIYRNDPRHVPSEELETEVLMPIE